MSHRPADYVYFKLRPGFLGYFLAVLLGVAGCWWGYFVAGLFGLLIVIAAVFGGGLLGWGLSWEAREATTKHQEAARISLEQSMEKFG